MTKVEQDVSDEIDFDDKDEEIEDGKKHDENYVNKLTDYQRSILIGSMLGDGHLSLNGRSPRLKIDRAIKDLDYLEFEYSIFKDYCKSGVKIFERYDDRYKTTYKQCSFRTGVSKDFLDLYNKWYPAQNRVKVVPSDLKFDPVILAIWFADDGNIVVSKTKNLTLKLSSHSFGYSGTTFLANKLYDYFNVKFPIFSASKDKTKDQYFIKASTKPCNAFLKAIKPELEKLNITRKYDMIKDLDLDYIPKIGRPKTKKL